MNVDKLQEFVVKKLKKELSDKLTYHRAHHTIGVLKVCREYIKRMNIPESDAYLLETAALMHDTGFLFTYENHEEASKNYAKEILPGWNYTSEEIEKICGMIEATKIPQKPKNLLEQIIGDSDLNYLGTDKFYDISETLYNELLAFNKIPNREEWNKLQVKFLQNHCYHTPFAQQHREPIKQKHLSELIKKTGG